MSDEKAPTPRRGMTFTNWDMNTDDAEGTYVWHHFGGWDDEGNLALKVGVDPDDWGADDDITYASEASWQSDWRRDKITILPEDEWEVLPAEKKASDATTRKVLIRRSAYAWTTLHYEPRWIEIPADLPPEDVSEWVEANNDGEWVQTGEELSCNNDGYEYEVEDDPDQPDADDEE